MRLSEANVIRTWRAEGDSMVYRMSVNLGGEPLLAEVRTNYRSLLTHWQLPAEYIERELAGKIIGHIRESLFPKS